MEACDSVRGLGADIPVVVARSASARIGPVILRLYPDPIPSYEPRREAQPSRSFDGTDPLRDLHAHEAKANATWNALSSLYGSRLSQVAIDHLYARFIMGLTSPGFGEDAPALHLEVCRRLLALNLPPERIEAALHDVPPLAEAWVEAAFAAIEGHGQRAAFQISNGHDAAAGVEEGRTAEQ